MKYKHQPSGRGLLLTISTSVGKYLYAGEIRKKTHLKSKDTQPSVQVNTFLTNQVQAHGLEGPQTHVTGLEQWGIRHN